MLNETFSVIFKHCTSQLIIFQMYLQCFLKILENSKREGARLLKEAAEVEPFFVGDVPIHFDGNPSLSDLKTKNYWSETEVGQASCYGCGATPTGNVYF